MKKSPFLFLMLVALVAIGSAFTLNYAKVNSDLVWFEVDQNGNAINPANGTRGAEPPISCAGSTNLCARALSISQGEVSLVPGSSTVYQVNTGYSTATHYDDERLKP